MVLDLTPWYLYRPDALAVWKSEDVKRRLWWYYRVMKNIKPAKFIIVKHVEVFENPAKLDYEGLWGLHDEIAKEFRIIFKEIAMDKLSVEELPNPKHSFLDLKIALAKEMLKSCIFCERKCKVNRLRGERGHFCKLDYRTYVHSWFHHLGEEAPLVPSGTIFYGSCNFRCVFCQNFDISQENIYNGILVTAKSLATIQKELRNKGARNINHVGGDPTPNIHTIVESLKSLDVNVPQLWNSNMYLTVEAMKILVDIIDIWLPDFKYGNDKCALRLSGVPRYFEVVTRNLKMAVEHGDMIIRHLVLPNHVECCTKPVLRWIAENLPKEKVLVNIMEQYRPEYKVLREPEKWRDIIRRPGYDELSEAYSYAKKLGIVFEPVS